MKTKFQIWIVIAALTALSACSALPVVPAASSIVNVPKNAPPQQSTAVPTPVPVAQSSVPGTAGLLAAYEGTLEDIYGKVNPSVVNIQVVSTVSTSQGQTLPFFGGQNNGQQQTQQALGSGFVWDQQGNIVTNNHVIDGATKIDVTFNDGTTVPGKLVGRDPDSDLAVIKVDLPADKLQPVTMGDSTQVKVGELAIAIGNPFGLQGTMTSGIISGLERTLPVSDTSQSSNQAGYSIPDIIQTDAAINPGNSGGVLVDMQGNVLGVTSAIESPVRANSGVGFVIPSAIVKKVVPALIQTGKFEHSWLGISGTSMNPDLAKAMNLATDQRGVLLVDITANGPAAKAGLKGSTKTTTIAGQDYPIGGDVITSIDGQTLNKVDDLIAYLASNTTVGQKISLTILRDAKEQQIDVTLQARPVTPVTSQNVTPQQQNGSIYLGITGTGLNANLAKAMNIPADSQGVLIERVDTGSPASLAGLKGSTLPSIVNGQPILVGGDIITAVDGQAVATMASLRGQLANHASGDVVTLSILRGGKPMDIDVTLAVKTN
jgi:serine protease Do